MTAYIHRAERPSHVHRPRRILGRPPPPRSPRDAAPICPLGETLLEDARQLWERRWSPFYASLDNPLVGAPTRKTLASRLGLMAVCLHHATPRHAPEGSNWRVSMMLDDAGEPAALGLTRGEASDAIPISLVERSLQIGPRSVFMAAPNAARAALRAMAGEAGEFFAQPTRRIG